MKQETKESIRFVFGCLVWFLFGLCVVAGFSALLSCNVFAGPATQPPTGKGTPYPCGYRGVMCDVGSGGGCCDEDEVCGYDRVQDPTHTCPKGMCCFVGPHDNFAELGSTQPKATAHEQRSR